MNSNLTSDFIETLKINWKKISQQGLRDSMPMSEQKKIILTNQVSILLFLFLVSYMAIFNISTSKFTPIIFLLISTILIAPYQNKRGKYRFTSFMISVIFPINVLIFSSLFKLQDKNNIDIIYYIVPRLFIIGGLVIPLILIDVRHKTTLVIAVIINFTCLVTFDLICNLFGVGFDITSVSFQKYGLINIYIVLPYLLILFGLGFLLNINLKYERKVQELMENLKGKNTELERQKEYIEKIHLEITDSINYAKRIQSAILPDSNLLSGHFADHFILFKPRNVVSGDFYWFTKVENHIIVTVADCTGHGVPGAFMSMLGMSYLREIVQKEYMTEPSRILYKLRKEIVNTLNQKGIQSEQKDGMDISLISINFSDCDTESDKSFEMQWAGANNPCWIIKNGEFFELKPDKMPIGIHDKMEKFTAQKVTLHSGDLIYLAGDGYKDQFGGPKSKKFMSKRLKELLINSSGGTMDNQKAILEKAIDEWQNGYEIKHEQTDDITILGIRI